jgi:hypothetical protein
MTPSPAIDIHQHLWPPELVEALRSRTAAPRLAGWTLLLDGEPPYRVAPADHDPASRRALDEGRIVLGLSSPLGIEDLPADEGRVLLDAWHSGARALRPDFDAWASASRDNADLEDLRAQLDDGFVGLQIPATWLSGPAAVEQLAPVLDILTALDRPVFVHPGPVVAPVKPDSENPGWWSAVVDYPAQLVTAWWSWYVAGRTLFPRLRICFSAGAGLAPVHHERFVARSGRPFAIDPATFVETSSYSRQGVDSLIRVLGVDAIVIGSDRPYAQPYEPDMGDAARYAFRTINPLRLLEGTRS